MSSTPSVIIWQGILARGSAARLIEAKRAQHHLNDGKRKPFILFAVDGMYESVCVLGLALTLLPVFYHHFLSVCLSLSFPRDISLSPVLQFIPLSQCLSLDSSISSVFLSLSFTHCFKFFIIASGLQWGKCISSRLFLWAAAFSFVFSCNTQIHFYYSCPASTRFFNFFLLHHF